MLPVTRIAVAATLLFSGLAAPVQAATNTVPPVAPAIQQWEGGAGDFTLSPRSRIVTEDLALQADARTFAADLRRITQGSHPLVLRGPVRPGDIVLALDGGAPQHREGYRLTIGDNVTIAARQPIGVSRGAQTALQLFALGRLPRGVATDWPRLAQRGVMIDAARRFYEPAYIEQQIRTAAWYKLNTYHLHLTESEAFRLASPKFPGLAPAQSYTRADIARFEAIAAKYHVTIVPEIDLPGHAGAIADHWPVTTWDCESMKRKPYPVSLDVTKAETRALTKQLLDEFVPWFTGPEFHVGGDEFPGQSNMDECPEVVAYAKERGFASTADVMVDYINQMDAIVRADGKRTVIWNWWDVKEHSWKPNLSPTIHPNKAVKVEVWWNSEQPYLDMGYDVVSSPYRRLYVVPGGVPGGKLLPVSSWMHNEWQQISAPRLAGYMISRWADSGQSTSDAFQDWFAHRSQQLLADRTWGGPRHGTHFDYENRVDRIGPAPGVTFGSGAVTADARKVLGTAFGSSPGFEKASDGDPGTFFEHHAANGGYVGVDAGHPVRAGKVRFVPRSQTAAHLIRMIGGKLQGCTDGPDQGCVDLATVTWRPPGHDWLQLPVSDPGSYRWLRYLSPASGLTSIAELEFWTS